MGDSIRRLLALVVALNLCVAAPKVVTSLPRFSVANPPWFKPMSPAHRSKPILAMIMVPRTDAVVSRDEPRVPCWHRVVRGESIWSIALHYGTVPQAIVRANGIKDANLLQAGKRIRVVKPTQAEIRIVVAKRGDTFAKLARVYGMTPDALRRLNSIPDPTRPLYIGQKLVVPAPMPLPAKPVISRSNRTAYGAIILAWPLSGRLTSFYGMRGGQMHYGIDVAAPEGTPVRASASGKVKFAGWYGGYGLLVVLDHGGSWLTYYGHNSRITVQVGQLVQCGEPIAEVGRTGQATGSHLHFELRHGSQRLNPFPNLPHR